MRNSKIHHNAYFWLNNPNDPVEKDCFLTALKKFIDSNPFVNQCEISEPVDGKCKEAVDRCSYNFYLRLTFNRKEEYESYKEDSSHGEFVNEVGHLWRKVQVFNSEEIWNAVLKPETV